MKKDTETNHLQQSVMNIARTDFPTLRDNITIQQALDNIRSYGLGDKIVYFYVVDGNNALVGVLPTRRLLTTPLHQRLSDVMISRVVAISRYATVLEAYESFVIHKLLAFPVVDEKRHIIGVVDVGMFTDEVFDVADQERMDEVFETLGFRISRVREASPFRSFRFRFPWLLATIASGTICALFASVFAATLAQSLVLAFFLTLILGLGESVSIQSMTVTIQALRFTRPTLRWYVKAFWREAGAALLLGAACGLTVGLIVVLWYKTVAVALTIGGGIMFALSAACLFGLSVPTLLHALKLDLRIAAGPLTLAVTDISTLVLYFSLATLLL